MLISLLTLQTIAEKFKLLQDLMQCHILKKQNYPISGTAVLQTPTACRMQTTTATVINTIHTLSTTTKTFTLSQFPFANKTTGGLLWQYTIVVYTLLLMITRVL